MNARALVAVAVVSLWLAASASGAPPEPWEVASDARLALTDAEAALVLGEPQDALALLATAERAIEIALSDNAGALRSARRSITDAQGAVARGDEAGLAAARAAAWTTILRASYAEATKATARGRPDVARSWLLVREFRAPTRFSRAAADATLALDELSRGSIAPGQAAVTVRRDLLDTYDARLRTSLAEVRDADGRGFEVTHAEMAALALGYWRILAPVYRTQRGAAATGTLTHTFELLAASSTEGTGATRMLDKIERAIGGFRAAPLSEDELVRRAGQLERFLRLVPIEYGRGVKDRRVTLEFEIQEAITFRDGAAAAFHDVQPTLVARGAAAAERLESELDLLGAALAAAIRGDAVATPEEVRVTTDRALVLLSDLYPASWKEAAKTADFDVISVTLGRLRAAAASADWKAAESARLEAYGVFELGPEQRLRGLAPSLFREIEGYFWYGAEGHDGLVQLINRRSEARELAATLSALDGALARAEQRIGNGPQSQLSVVTNSAVIVFREGLEAVLILAALMASLVGDKRRFRRPMLAGVGLALVATALTWVVAQTVLSSLQRYGERLEAVVSLFAIGVLLLILNWFFHRVYWRENLQGLHRRKRRVLMGAGLSLAAAQVVGLVLLGFSSVYREGFETVLFLQAMTLEAGALTVLEGAALGLAGTVAVFVLVVALEQKLPHKKMLVTTGILITWVLVVMVGTTVQTLQKVGWLTVTPIEGFDPPYWAGVWLGLFPTWQGVIAQAAAAVFVLGSYVAAEGVQRRRRTRLMTPAISLAGKRQTEIS